MKVRDNDHQEAVPRRRGRPASGTPPLSNAERQRAYRLRLKKQGKQVVHLSLLPKVVLELDSLRRDGTSREAVVERLVKAAAQRRKR